MNQQTSSNSGDLFTFMRKNIEAHAVRNGLPVTRQFSDTDLAECQQRIAEAERDLYGMTNDERLGTLSPVERAKLNDLNARTLLPFRALVTLPDRTEIINILAPNAVTANIKVVELLFGDFSEVRPMGFKIAIERIKGKDEFLQRAA